MPNGGALAPMGPTLSLPSALQLERSLPCSLPQGVCARAEHVYLHRSGVVLATNCSADALFLDTLHVAVEVLKPLPFPGGYLPRSLRAPRLGSPGVGVPF